MSFTERLGGKNQAPPTTNKNTQKPTKTYNRPISRIKTVTIPAATLRFFVKTCIRQYPRIRKSGKTKGQKRADTVDSHIEVACECLGVSEEELMK